MIEMQDCLFNHAIRVFNRRLVGGQAQREISEGGWVGERFDEAVP